MIQCDLYDRRQNLSAFIPLLPYKEKKKIKENASYKCYSIKKSLYKQYVFKELFLFIFLLATQFDDLSNL